MTRSAVEPKPPWRQVPVVVRRQVESLLDSPVRRGMRIWGGYAPTPTFRLLLADGGTAIFKGTNTSSSDLMRRILADEERVYRELGPQLQPRAPALLGSVRYAGWHALLLEDVGPPQVPPWTDRLARAALREYAAFHRSSLGHDHWPDWLPRDGVAKYAMSWQDLLANQEGVDAAAALAGSRTVDARRWLGQFAPVLAAVAGQLIGARPPCALLHLDTRSDNLRIQGGTRLRLFDWPYTALGPAEFDLAAFVQTIRVESGPTPETCVAWYAEGMDVRADLLDASVAAVSGFFAARAWQPPLPGLPRLRGFQRQQLKVSLTWAADRLRLPAPEWLEPVEP